MEFGAAIFFTDYAMSPAALGRALEERGFESLWAPEHSHIPLSRQSPFPQGGELPKKYYDVMDPFVTLVAAATATTRYFKKMALEAGRDLATIPITSFGVAEDPELIKRYQDAGVARLVFNLPPAQADEVLPVLDRCARLMQ